jgi:hypothetical protein
MIESEIKDTKSHSDIFRGKLAFSCSLNPANAFLTARIISGLKYAIRLFILLLLELS